MLYGALSRAAFALSYRKVIAYTLGSEPGTSLIAAVFEQEATTRGGSWSRKGRPRSDDQPLEAKRRWARSRP
jgi:hypothetical protein